MKALAPGLLVAMPQLTDPNFERSVVLLVHHDEDGSMGFVINQRSTMTFAELAVSEQALEIAPERAHDALLVGGPVERHRGFVLHDAAHVEESTELVPGLSLSVTTDALGVLLKDPTVRLRLLMGYAGWDKGQLEREIAAGAWFFADATPELVLASEPRSLWSTVLEGLGVAPGWLAPSQGIH